MARSRSRSRNRYDRDDLDKRHDRHEGDKPHDRQDRNDRYDRERHGRYDSHDREKRHDRYDSHDREKRHGRYDREERHGRYDREERHRRYDREERHDRYDRDERHDRHDSSRSSDPQRSRHLQSHRSDNPPKKYPDWRHSMFSLHSVNKHESKKDFRVKSEVFTEEKKRARRACVEFLNKLYVAHRFLPQTLYRSVMQVDKYIKNNKENLDTHDIEMSSIACLCLAARLYNDKKLPMGMHEYTLKLEESRFYGASELDKRFDLILQSENYQLDLVVPFESVDFYLSHLGRESQGKVTKVLLSVMFDIDAMYAHTQCELAGAATLLSIYPDLEKEELNEKLKFVTVDSGQEIVDHIISCYGNLHDLKLLKP